MNLPNYITLTRIAAIPLLIWILCTPRLSDTSGDREILASTVFILASMTDGIDGYLARKRGQITTMGMLLDPLADKLLIAAAFVTLVQFNPALVPAWIAVVIIGREFLVSGLRSIAASEGFTIQASELGKFKMLVQIISVVAVILARRWHDWPVGSGYVFPVYWIALARDLVHGAAVAGVRHRLLRRLLVAHRPDRGKAAQTAGLRPLTAEETRCPERVRAMSRTMSRPSSSTVATGARQARADSEFTREQRHLLLGIARAAIASGLAGEPLPDSPPTSSSSSPSSDWPGLTEPRGVFTTLYLAGELRGCVGYAFPIRPLFRAVAETARAAAFEDSRFWPVTPEEARELQISLSVLSPLFPIAASEVEVGRHGLLISDGKRRGLLLPQVPVEHELGPRNLSRPNLPQGRLAP